MGVMDRLPIYEKVKIVEGENFVTIEDTKNLEEEEMVEFVHHFMDDLAFANVPSMNVLVNSHFSGVIDRVLEDDGFELHDHVVMVRKQLYDLTTSEKSPFVLRSLHELVLEEFTHIWKEASADSPNVSSMSTIGEQMQNVMKELGPSYKNTCQVVYKNARPIGVVMPHIEPGTDDEGRLFYFGLIPCERGKRKSISLHKQVLQMLRDDFGASYYIGSTSVNNIPMLKTFEANGCSVIDRNRVFTRKGN